MKSFLLIILLIISNDILAAPRGPSWIRLQPIIGFERVQKILPTPHSKNRLIYGGRLLLGPSFFAMETEFVMGKDDEHFPARDLTIEEETQRLKVGLRSSLRFFPGFSWVLRGGAQGRKNKMRMVESGVVTNKSTATRVHPYIGTGFDWWLFGNFSASGDFTVVLTDYPKEGDREYQSSLGFSIRI